MNATACCADRRQHHGRARRVQEGGAQGRGALAASARCPLLVLVLTPFSRAQALDKLMGGLPVQVTEAKVDSVAVEVPWSSYMPWSTYGDASGCAKVEIRGLHIDLIPRELPGDAEPQAASATTGAAKSPGRRALLSPERQPQVRARSLLSL